jgi:hypothetical protein
MRILIGLIAILTASTYFTTFSPAGAAPAEPAEAPGTVQCPDYVDTGILNPPQGWTPQVQPGTARLALRTVSVAKEDGRPTVYCGYAHGMTIPTHLLRRAFPPYYVCLVDKPGAATCAPRTKANRD